jgi:hypothetical protein
VRAGYSQARCLLVALPRLHRWAAELPLTPIHQRKTCRLSPPQGAGRENGTPTCARTPFAHNDDKCSPGYWGLGAVPKRFVVDLTVPADRPLP